jgi:hypothetical protein
LYWWENKRKGKEKHMLCHVSCRVTRVSSERDSSYSRQIMLLPRKTKNTCNTVRDHTPTPMDRWTPVIWTGLPLSSPWQWWRWGDTSTILER